MSEQERIQRCLLEYGEKTSSNLNKFRHDDNMGEKPELYQDDKKSLFAELAKQASSAQTRYYGAQ